MTLYSAGLLGPDVLAVQEHVGREGVPQSFSPSPSHNDLVLDKAIIPPRYRGPSGRIAWTGLVPRAVPWA